jgi:hypothetical protein
MANKEKNPASPRNQTSGVQPVNNLTIAMKGLNKFHSLQTILGTPILKSQMLL